MNILRKRPPHIAEVHCERIQFQPGDRVLVRTFTDLELEQKRKLQAAVQRWAGKDVEVLIYNGLQMELTIEHGQPKLSGIDPG